MKKNTAAMVLPDAPVIEGIVQKCAQTINSSTSDFPDTLLMIGHSKGPINNATVTPREISWDELQEEFKSPEIGDKDGSYFTCLPFKNDHRNRKNAQGHTGDIFVLDGDSNIDPGTEEVTSGAPPPAVVSKVLTDLDITHCIYSSHSNVIKGYRYRVVILCTWNGKSELEALVVWIIQQLHEEGIWLNNVQENINIACAWFYPRVTDEAAIESFEFYQHDGQQPFPKAEALEWYRETNKRAQAKSRAQDRRNDVLSGLAADNPRGKVEDALKHIDPDIIRGKWVDVLMAIHSLDADWGLQVADAWSSQGNKYKGLDDLQTRWNSFSQRDHGITIATLYWMAHENGWAGWMQDDNNDGKANHQPVTQIVKADGRLEQNFKLAIRALADNLNNAVMQRGPFLVRVAHFEEPTDLYGVKIPKGTANITQLSQPDLILHMAKACDWVKWNDRKHSHIPTDPCQKVASTVLASAGSWGDIPILNGISEAPIIRSDGSIHDTPGYDHESRMYYEGRAPKLTVSINPTHADALAALGELMQPFDEFPFEDSLLDKAVILSYMLTMIVRSQIGLAPLHGFSATTPGTGKGLLVEVCNLITRGRDAAIMPPLAGNHAEEETRKRITAILLQGTTSISLDNWTVSVGGDSLNTLMTSTKWSDRILGASKTVALPSRVTWAATGNNLTTRGDMVRRSLLCSMDAGVEKPEQRSFTQDKLAEYVLQNRARLLSALFTILKAYRVSGLPLVEGTPLGRFEEWWHAICAPIIWLGLPDPTDSQTRLKQADPETEKLTALIESLHDCYGNAPVTLRKIRSDLNDIYNNMNADEKWMGLVEAMHEIAPSSSPFDSRAAGWYLRRNTGRVIGGKRLCVDNSKSRTIYSVVEA